ncbi:MAG: alpha/beta fold hydrolase [Gemmatimonadaceae bacterium]
MVAGAARILSGRPLARDVVRLLNHLGPGRAHVVGFSLGAHIVGYLAAKAVKKRPIGAKRPTSRPGTRPPRPP